MPPIARSRTALRSSSVPVGLDLRKDNVHALKQLGYEANMVWRLLHANRVNPYWAEIEHYHNFSRKRLYALLQEHGFEAVEYHVSERYRVCMEVIAIKR